MNKIFATLLVMILCLAFTAQTALACTIFCATDGETVLIGNNEDWNDRDCYGWFLPGGDGAYGRVCFGMEEADPRGGMNEAGLFFDLLMLRDPMRAPNPQSKPSFPSFELLLERCATVDEALLQIMQYDPSVYGYIQILLADQSGAYATVTWDWVKEELLIEKKAASYRAIGYGSPAITPMLEKGEVTVQNFQDMLDAAHQGDTTIYSNIYNPKTGDIYVYNDHNYNRYVQYNLQEELKKGKHIVYIPSLFPEQKPGKYNVTTPFQFFGTEAIVLMALFTAVFAFLGYYCVSRLIRKPKAHVLAAAAYCAGILGSAVNIAVMTFMFFHVPFVYRYGFTLFGFIASLLPWAQLALAAAMAVFSVIVWFRKEVRVSGKILYTFATASSVFLFLMLILPGIK